MSVTPPIASFFGLDPRFLGSPAAGSALINPLLFGSSNQMVPINFGAFYTGVPPIFGGGAFGGLQVMPFNMFAQPSMLMSPFAGGNVFGNGFGTQSFGAMQGVPSQFGLNTFTNAPVNPFGSFNGFM